MDCAVMSGGDVGPLGKDAVTELHGLFKWAAKSPRSDTYSTYACIEHSGRTPNKFKPVDIFYSALPCIIGPVSKAV